MIVRGVEECYLLFLYLMLLLVEFLLLEILDLCVDVGDVIIWCSSRCEGGRYVRVFSYGCGYGCCWFCQYVVCLGNEVGVVGVVYDRILRVILCLIYYVLLGVVVLERVEIELYVVVNIVYCVYVEKLLEIIIRVCVYVMVLFILGGGVYYDGVQ